MAETGGATNAEIAKRTKIRGGHRAHVKKILGKISGFIETYDPDMELEMLANRKSLEAKGELLRKFDEEILETLDDDDKILEEIEECEQIQIALKMKLLEVDNFLKGVKQEETENVIVTPQVGSHNRLKLPPLKIKEFTGDPKEFTSFKDAFAVAVDNVDAVSDVEKFTYLRSFLSGEAEASIRGLALTAANYNEAMEILNQRFGNKQVIVNSHMDALIKIPPVKNMEQTKKIRELYDDIESNLRSLNAIGVEPSSYGCLLVPIIQSKIPHTLKIHLSRRFDSTTDVWEIEDIMKALRTELEARERCENTGSSSLKEKPEKDFSTTEALLGQQKKSYEARCPYCEGDHFPDRCRVVTDVKRRKEILIKKRRCFICTRGNHLSRNCESARSCYNCQGKHHTSICYPNKGKDDKRNDENREVKRDVCAKKTNSTPAISTEGNILLQTAKLRASSDNKGQPMWCNVIMDTGSQRTYITKKFSNIIDAPVHHKESLIIGGFGGKTTAQREYDVVKMKLEGDKGKDAVEIQAVVVDRFCSALRGQCRAVNLDMYPHLRGLLFARTEENKEQEMQILIGLDHYWDIATGEVVKGDDGPVAMATKFGYILSGFYREGRIADAHQVLSTTVMRIDGQAEATIENEFKNFWDLETIGIKEECETEEFNINIERREGKYYVNLPFKSNHEILCDNYKLAEKRLESTLRMLKRNPELAVDYSQIMEEQEKNGIIEEVKYEDECPIGRTYYMPHHAVVRKDKPTSSVRIVYAANAKMFGAALNECLKNDKTGLTDLLAVVMRIRCYMIGVVADIEKAFLAIGIKAEDRDVLRFLWVDDPQKEYPVVRHMRFAVVCFGVISSMAILDRTIRHHLEEMRAEYPDIVDVIENAMYVDDFSSGENSEEKVIELYQKTKQIFKEANMNIRKWKTNNENVQKIIDDYEYPTLDNLREDRNFEPKQREHTKVLGITWDMVEDEFIFQLNSFLDNARECPTKREFLRSIASIFDPIGVFAPSTVMLKWMFQKTCKDSVGWDEKLKDDVQKKWSKWLNNAKEFKEVRIPRKYAKAPIKSVMIVGFGDASECAFAAVVYVVAKDVNGEKASSLVICKTRIAPLKQQSIPRLELLGALILSRLVVRVKSELEKIVEIKETVCLTDSEVVLNWIQGTKREYKQYVQNRVREIRRNVAVDAWYHVPGQENMADLPSRGCLPSQLMYSEAKHNWIIGAPWMLDDRNKWPIRNDVKAKFEDFELKTEKLNKDTFQSSILINANEGKSSAKNIIEFEKYGTLEALVSTVAWCVRFYKNSLSKFETMKGDLDASEYNNATNICIKSIQGDMKKIADYRKRFESLGVYEDEEGMLRCKGRIGKANIRFETKFPILLPANNPVTRLIVLNAHEKVFHNGLKLTLAQIRSVFWIIKGRQYIKKILSRCLLCKRLEGLAYPAPVTAELPRFRVDGGVAFETVGVDFCGPVYVKPIYGRGNDMHKAYIALNTCATSRMIHLELVTDLTTPSYIRSQKRLIARRGYPKMFVSDNAKTFKGIQLRRYNARNGIQWRFNLSKSPWWGGMFERLVRSVKRCLIKGIGHKKMNYEELLTILMEVELVLNNRPLTYIDGDDHDQILTPSHLFYGRRILDGNAMSGYSGCIDLDRTQAINRMRQIEDSVNHFWKRWVREYLVELRESHKMNMKGENANIRRGDVVLIHEEGLKRLKWKMGKVEELIRGKDDIIRGAILKYKKGDKEQKISRPLQLLYPLEVSDRHHLVEIQNTATDEKQASTDDKKEIKDAAADEKQASRDENKEIKDTAADEMHASIYDNQCSREDEHWNDDLNDDTRSDSYQGRSLRGKFSKTDLRSERAAAADGQLIRRLQKQI